MDDLFDVFDEKPNGASVKAGHESKSGKKRRANGEVKEAKSDMGRTQVSDLNNTDSSEGQKLYCGNLPYEASEQDLRDLFAGFSM